MSVGPAFPKRRITPQLRFPTGLQERRVIVKRRWLLAGLTGAITIFAAIFLSLILSSGGWTWTDTIILVSAIVILPAIIVDAVNSAIGFYLRHARRDGLANVAPQALLADQSPAVTAKTAIVLILRNDPVDDAVNRLKLIRSSLERTGDGGHFSYFILSDTSDPMLARREEECIRGWNTSLPDFAQVTYRRRLVNAGYKAGNLADFCRTWGESFDFVIPLDVSSFMSGPGILDLVRIMQAHPKIGILQSLVLPSPARSTFGRIAAFSERYQARIRAFGAAWWQADCAHYEGRNAILRISPFYLHCRMPHLTGRSAFSGAVIRHELVEAAMMQRAGYEVRSLPVETGSFADGSHSLFERVNGMAAVEQGALQLTRFLALDDLAPLYRALLLLRISDAVTPFFWMAGILLASLKAFENYDASGLSVGGVKFIYLTMLLCLIMPRVLGVIDTILSAQQIKSFGGYMRFILSALSDIALTFLLQPVIMFRATFALFRTPLLKIDSGPMIIDSALRQKPHSAFRSFWPASLYGIDLLLFMLLGSPGFALWSLPMTLGLVVAVPLAATLSSRRVYQVLHRLRLFVVPEISDPSREIAQFVAQDQNTKWDRAA